MEKLPSPADLYSHDKLILWWCFMFDIQSRFIKHVFERWLRKSATFDNEEERHVLFLLLCRNECAQQEFMECLEGNNISMVQSAVDVLNLACKHELTVTMNACCVKGFKDFLQKIINHIPGKLITNFLMLEKNHDDEVRISYMLDCIRWCRHQIQGDCWPPEIELKLVFYVTKICTYGSKNCLVEVRCLKFLELVISERVYSSDHRAWYIIAYNDHMMSMLEASVTNEQENIQYSSLQLLVTMIGYQVRNDVQSPTKVKISSLCLFKWLTMSKNFKVLAYILLRDLLKVNFEKTLVEILSEDSCNSHAYLSVSEFKLVYFHLQNSLVLTDPILNEVATSCLIDLIQFISKKDLELERFIMLQPWTGIMLEERLQRWKATDEIIFKLFFLWLCYEEENPSIVSAVQHLAKLLASAERIGVNQLQHLVIVKICKGTYNKHITPSTKEKLLSKIEDGVDKETELFSQVEELVKSCVIKPTDHPETNPGGTQPEELK